VWAIACGAARPTDSDDAPFRSLPEIVAGADEVVLGETVGEAPDRLTIRLLSTTYDRLREGEELTLPHPRLATEEGFVRFVPRSWYVYLLFAGVDDVWRVVESAELSTFPVRRGEVLVPAFFAPGTALPAKGPPLEIPLDTFFELVKVCRDRGEEACRKSFAAALERER
jgi:hypothetical protein